MASFFAKLNPALRTLLPTIASAYIIQGAVAVPCILFKTDKYYDLSGSLTYLSCTALSLYLPSKLNPAANGIIPGQSFLKTMTGGGHPRKIIASALLSIWAGRLGWYLYDRINKSGGDSRFDEIKESPSKFLVAFFAQATWVSLVGLPVFALNAVPSSVLPALGILDAIGLAIWAAGFLLEVTADRQMSAWKEARKNKKHSEEFIHEGVWKSVSRHPNYTGESTLWLGNAIFAAAALMSQNIGGHYYGGLGVAGAMCAVSPAFVTFLLTKVSGIPLSEEKYDKKLGGNKEYEEWKKNTPVFIPKLF